MMLQKISTQKEKGRVLCSVMSIFLEKQLIFLKWVAEHRSFALNQALLFLNFFDTPPFFLLLIPFFVVGISWKWGVRLFYLVLLSGSLNHFLKEFFAVARPCASIPELALIPCKELSFPSGGAQTAALLAGFIWWCYPKKWAKIASGIFALLLGCSRFLLGVHYPSDVLGGYFFGITLLLAFLCTHKKIEKAVIKKPYLSLGISTLIPTLLAFISPGKIVLFLGTVVGSSVGIFISGIFSLYSSEDKNLFTRLRQGGFAAFGTWFIWSFFPPLLENKQVFLLFIEGILLSLWVFFGALLMIRSARMLAAKRL